MEAYSANTINKLQQKFYQDRECNAEIRELYYNAEGFGRLPPNLQREYHPMVQSELVLYMLLQNIVSKDGHVKLLQIG